MPGTAPPPAAELGACDWCRGAPATGRFTVAPAKKNRAGEVLARATVVAVCDSCRARLEQRRADAEARAARERAEKRADAARAKARRAR